MDTKILPKALNVEETVLGTFLYLPKSFSIVSNIIYEDCFTTDDNRNIFKVIKQLYVENKPIDMLSVADNLNKSKIKFNIAYLASLTSKSTGNYNIENQCKILVEKHFSRETILNAHKAINSCLDGLDIFDTINTLISDVNTFTGKLITDMPKSFSVLLSDWEKKEINSKNGLTGIDTGIKGLNELLGGWQNTDLVVLAARPGMGKTSFVLHQTLQAAKQGKKVLFFSLEMASEQLVQRILSLETGIELERIRKKQITQNEINVYGTSYDNLMQMPIFIDDKSKANTFIIKNKMLTIQRNYGLDLVIIDFVQLMQGDVKNTSRNDELDKITRELKGLAKEFNVPIIILSQLSRDVEKRQNKIPMLSDLRESGGIEQNADIVMFIYRAEYYSIFEDENGNDLRGKADLVIAKHRNGSCNDVKVGWNGSQTKFFDLEANFIKPNENFNNPF